MVYGVTRIDLPSCDWSAARPASGVDAEQVSTNKIPLGHAVDGPLKAGTGEDILASFVAGPENRLAVPVLQRLLSGEASHGASILFNPLVLVGPTGTGKSLLVRGIARRWSQLLGPQATGYFSAADLGRQLRSARSAGHLDAFRKQLSCLQLLIVEDIHRLGESLFVQRELRHVLDDAGSVVVLTAQKPPAAHGHLEAGLRDRLAGGLILRLRPPGLEAREHILQLAANARGVRLDAKQRLALAQNIVGSAPHLFRALTEWELHPSTGERASQGQRVGCKMRSGNCQPVELKQITALVARYFSLTQAALRGAARRKSLVYARGIAVFLARSLSNLSYAQIGQGLGGRDHTTVMHAQQTTEKLVATDPATQQTIEELRRILTSV